jgi:hypothetical protein
MIGRKMALEHLEFGTAFEAGDRVRLYRRPDRDSRLALFRNWHLRFAKLGK